MPTTNILWCRPRPSLSRWKAQAILSENRCYVETPNKVRRYSDACRIILQRRNLCQLDRHAPKSAICFGELAVGPVYHHAENRIDSHIVLSSMAYGQFVTPKHNAKRCAPGLTLCATFERFSTTQKVDFQLPTTDGASSCCAIRNRIEIRSSHWFSSNSGFPNNRCPGLHPIRPCWKTQTKSPDR